MKRLSYLLTIITFLSCVQNTKEKHQPVVKAPDVVQDRVTVAIDSVKKIDNVSFNKIISDIKTKSTRVIDTTNFDNFKEINFYNKQEVSALKLKKLYPDFYKETYNYKATSSYKINFSSNFHSIVVTILKGDNEMESILINYDFNGKIIDSKVISYDEIAEGMSKIESTIDQDKITIDHILWIDDKQVETKVFEIKANGKIAPVSQNGEKTTEKDAETILYSEYTPERLENIQINKFEAEHTHQLDSYKVVSGNYKPEDGQLVAPDTKTDWGDRLLLLNSKNEIVYKSRGVGDIYLFEPHFYKSNSSNKIIIICQLAYEYAFGGEAFIFEKGKIERIGRLDIEGYGEEKYLTEIVKIYEKDNRLEFTFKSDSLVLEPSSVDIVIKNDNVKYIYKANRLTLEKE